MLETEMRGVAGLLAAAGRGDRIKYLFFWGHQPGRVGDPGTGCLSQWWPAEFTVDGIAYRTAEHYMMAAKARLFGDDETAARIVAAGHRVLVEASPMDRVWGIGLAAQDERAARPAEWRGQNLFGFALMEVRRRLREAR